MTRRLDGRVAMVTGANQGLGYQTAEVRQGPKPYMGGDLHGGIPAAICIAGTRYSTMPVIRSSHLPCSRALTHAGAGSARGHAVHGVPQRTARGGGGGAGEGGNRQQGRAPAGGFGWAGCRERTDSVGLLVRLGSTWRGVRWCNEHTRDLQKFSCVYGDAVAGIGMHGRGATVSCLCARHTLAPDIAGTQLLSYTHGFRTSVARCRTLPPYRCATCPAWRPLTRWWRSGRPAAGRCTYWSTTPACW